MYTFQLIPHNSRPGRLNFHLKGPRDRSRLPGHQEDIVYAARPTIYKSGNKREWGDINNASVVAGLLPTSSKYETKGRDACHCHLRGEDHLVGRARSDRRV